MNDTIFALATPPGRSGVAVLRISGTQAAKALTSLGIIPLPAPRLAALADLHHPQTNETIDRALVLWFPAPASFTGEDVAELHIHGSRAVIQELLEVLSDLEGLRLAEPGEFSQRAFMNGKMDLTAAEGLADLIDAETASQKKQALRAISGEMEGFYASLRENTLHLLALLEAYIDFPDEEIPENVLQDIEHTRQQVITSIAEQLQDNHAGERIRGGLKVAIIGPPNSGKSTLLNALSGREAAIVSTEAGTTRDIIEVQLDLGGLAVTLMDTAGIRKTDGEVESQGISRALAAADNADIVLAVLDPFSPALLDIDTLSLQEKREGGSKSSHSSKTILILNKSDLGPLPSRDWLNELQTQDTLHISAREKHGLDALLKTLQAHAEQLTTAQTPPMITRLRHRRALETALKHLEAFANETELELQCEQLRCASIEIAKITGRITVDEILGEIFGRFCIGK